MNLQNVEKIETQESHEKTWFQRFRGKLVATSAVATGAVVATSANANVDELFTNMATEVSGISTGAMTVITVLAGVLVLLLGWAYFKKVK